MQAESDALRGESQCIGLVPTMGYLHEGHLSLIRIARREADAVVVSIFVNPTQFGPDEDLEAYPRDFERDEKLAAENGADILFYPSVREMYPEGYATFVNVTKITESLCGASRPVHFRGVVTVCTKLFHAVKPHFAVFGQKDAQQVAVIKRLVEDLNFDMDIVVGSIIREKDGLAMSSRNAYLSEIERKDALVLIQSILRAEEMVGSGERDVNTIIQRMIEMIDEKDSTRIDYVSIVDPVTMRPLDKVEGTALIALAVYVGETRLIDNTVVKA